MLNVAPTIKIKNLAHLKTKKTFHAKCCPQENKDLAQENKHFIHFSFCEHEHEFSIEKSALNISNTFDNI